MGTELFSVGNGDNNLRVAYSLYIGGNLVGSNAYRSFTVSTGDPSGGSSGDVWYKY